MLTENWFTFRARLVKDGYAIIENAEYGGIPDVVAINKAGEIRLLQNGTKPKRRPETCPAFLYKRIEFLGE